MSFFFAVVWILIIAFLHAIPGSDLPTYSFLDFLHVDKWVHVFLFAFAFFLITRLFTLQYYQQHQRYIIAFLTIYGLILECCQEYFFISRSMDMFDWLADCVGVIMAVLIIRKFPSFRPYFFKKS